MSKQDSTLIRQVCEAAMMAAGGPLSLDRLQTLFDDDQQPSKQELIDVMERIGQDCRGRGIELIEVASGYRFQVRSTVAPMVARLWEEKPQRYSRALMETLSLIAYRQPITRGDIEDVRGVVVSSNMIKTLTEREWIRVVGYRDVPGRPAMYATTNEFLDYFGLSSLEQLPSLIEIKELDEQNRRLELGDEANAKTAPDADYQFSTDEEIAQRGAQVMTATDEDLSQANELISQVEDNVYEEDSENGGRRVRDLGQILERLSASPKNEEGSEPDEAIEVEGQTSQDNEINQAPESGKSDEPVTDLDTNTDQASQTDTKLSQSLEAASSNNDESLEPITAVEIEDQISQDNEINQAPESGESAEPATDLSVSTDEASQTDTELSQNLESTVAPSEPSIIASNNLTDQVQDTDDSIAKQGKSQKIPESLFSQE